MRKLQTMEEIHPLPQMRKNPTWLKIYVLRSQSMLSLWTHIRIQ